jgi:hypothetical protein
MHSRKTQVTPLDPLVTLTRRRGVRAADQFRACARDASLRLSSVPTVAECVSPETASYACVMVLRGQGEERKEGIA